MSNEQRAHEAVAAWGSLDRAAEAFGEMCGNVSIRARASAWPVWMILLEWQRSAKEAA